MPTYYAIHVNIELEINSCAIDYMPTYYAIHVNIE